MLRALSWSGLIVLAMACESRDDSPSSSEAPTPPETSSELPPFSAGYGDRYRLIEPFESAPTFWDIAPLVGLADLAAGWGLSWNDFDDDEDLDLWFANHMHYPSDLFVNNDLGSWSRSELPVGRVTGLDDHMGIWADYDGDGDSDLYTTNGFYRPDHLFRNDGDGEFVEVTTEAQVDLGNRGRGRSALWADLDGNGWHDIVVYNLFTRDFYYQNRGDGTFDEVALEAGTANSLGKRGAIAGDFDGDGDLDLFLPLGGAIRNLLLLNRGDGVFIEHSEGSGADIPGASRSAASGDYDNDGDLDLYITRADGLGDALLRNRGDATFEDVTAAAGIALVERGVRNAAFVDLDNDGDLDLYTTSGGSHDGPNGNNVLFLNRGDGTFEDVTERSGSSARAPGNTGSAAFGDANGDGWIDIALTNGGGARAISGPHQLLRNRGPSPNQTAHWARLHLSKSSGSRDGLGAQVEAQVGDRRLTRPELPIRTMAQDAPGTALGLGADTSIDQVRVTWPDGTWTQQHSLPGDRVHAIAASVRPRALDSHPAALLGEAPLLDLEAVEQRLAERYPPGSWPAPAVAEIHRRRDRVLASWLAARLAEDISLTEADVAQAYQQHLPSFQLPRRLWVDQIAAGKFTTFKRAPRLPWDAIRVAADALLAGEDALVALTQARIRAWGRADRTDSEAEPEPEEPDDEFRGYLEAGWITEAGLVERYGAEIASQVLATPVHGVIGPFKAREGRDVQPSEKVWPILRVFRVSQREEALTLELPLVADELRRSLRREKIRQVVQTTIAPGLQEDDPSGDVLFLEGIRFPVGPMADAARERIGDGLLPGPIPAAFTRIEAEARLDAALLAYLETLAPTEDEIAARVEQRRVDWTRPARIRGTLIFGASERLAAPVHAALSEGRPLAEILQEYQIPSLDHSTARSNGIYSEPILVDRGFAERLLRADVFDELRALEPGQVSRLLVAQEEVKGKEEYRMVVLEKHLPTEPPSPELARRLALRELLRERREASLDELILR